jgi:4-alpha-glucanotransferase
MLLASQHRMNTPGTIDGNWLWRFSEEMLGEKEQTLLAGLVSKYRR